ncbi:hypothetical protein C8Q79DRAFT_483792 [Trametes meyenii]|nr:hypothetical protein C8Q79DRAFT_483792 [Trametes meyenii]
MVHTKKAERLPPSSFAEPSEPSQVPPEDKSRSKDTLRGEQEENPQLVAARQPRRAQGARLSREEGGGRNRGAAVNGGDAELDGARVMDEEKRKDVAGGFGVGRPKL